MEKSNTEIITRMIDLLANGLMPFVEQALEDKYGPHWAETWDTERRVRRNPDDTVKWDCDGLLSTMMHTHWAIFKLKLGYENGERSWIGELIRVRNRWAHQEGFNLDQTLRALETAKLLLEAVSAPEQAEVREMHREYFRKVYEKLELGNAFEAANERPKPRQPQRTEKELLEAQEQNRDQEDGLQKESEALAHECKEQRRAKKEGQAEFAKIKAKRLEEEERVEEKERQRKDRDAAKVPLSHAHRKGEEIVSNALNDNEHRRSYAAYIAELCESVCKSHPFPG